MVPDLAADPALARSLADVAAEVALPYVGAPVRWGHEADGSPVSEADLHDVLAGTPGRSGDGPHPEP